MRVVRVSVVFGAIVVVGILLCYGSSISPRLESNTVIVEHSASIEVTMLTEAKTIVMENSTRGANLSAFAREIPSLTVNLGTFFIDRYEVTNAGYRRFVSWIKRTGDHRFCHPDEPPNKDHTPSWMDEVLLRGDDFPVVGIDWFDAYAFARWSGGKLPTEAEWEKSARGSGGLRYPWGNRWDWRLGNFAFDRDGFLRTAPVHAFPEGKSPYGCYNMAGNVWEWCLDGYVLPNGKLGRILKGGSWLSLSNLSRSAGRASAYPLFRHRSIGFRCVYMRPPAPSASADRISLRGGG